MTTPIDGVAMNWQQAQDVLACVEQLVGRHARLMQQAPALSGAADRCAEDAVEAIEAIADPLARWADALDDWDRMAAQQASERDALTDRLIAGLLAAQATSEDEMRTVIRAAFGEAPAADDAAPAHEAVEPSSIAVAPVFAATDAASASDAPEPDAAPHAAPLFDAAPHAAPLFDAVRDLLAPPAPAAPPPAATPADARINIMDVVPHRLVKELPGPSDSAELSAAFDFLLHDEDPLADAEPAPFDFGDAPANDDLSALQSKDLEGVIEATPDFEVEDTTMGSLGLMDTSALSTDQVRAQLKKIRAERAAAAVAAATDPPDAVEPVSVVEPASVVEPLFVGLPAAIEPAVTPEPNAVIEVEPADIEGSRDPTEAKPMLIAAPSRRDVPFPRLPRRTTDPLVELAVVEVESGPIDVLDVRQLLGEPPARPSRIDAAVRAALSSPPEAGREPESSPGTATVDHTDWLEATPTSYPPAPAYNPLGAAESIEIELGSVDLVGDGQPEMDSTVALQSVDLSAAMEAVHAEDWLDASQSVDILTSNQSLKALAGLDEPAADDPWAALDISTHGELKAGYASQARPNRAMLSINIGIEYAGRFFTARSVNISSTGVLVTCNENLADGERVDLFFEMPQGESIAVQATVSRSLVGDPGGIGLAFITLRYDDRVVIDRYVTARTS